MLNARGLSRFGLQKRIEKHLHVPRRLARRDHPQRSGVYTTMASCTLDKGRLTDHVSLTRRHSAKRATGMRYVQPIRGTRSLEYISLVTNWMIPLFNSKVPNLSISLPLSKTPNPVPMQPRRPLIAFASRWATPSRPPGISITMPSCWCASSSITRAIRSRAISMPSSPVP